MFFATVFLAGQAVAAFGMPDRDSCRDLVSVMRHDIALEYAEQPYGLWADGAIRRAGDWSASCENKKLVG